MRKVASRCVGLALALALLILGLGSLGIVLLAPVQAQTVPKYLEGAANEAVQRDRRNNWTVGIAGGQLSGTYMTFANELAEVLDDGDNMRVIPIVTYGAASNMDDLLYLRQVDIAVTQADVFDYFRTQRKITNLGSRLNYIVRLPLSEVHILATADIQTIDDLKGKKVSFGPAGSASSLTGTIVFQRLGIQVEQALVDNPTALQKLKSGEIAALVRVIGKPIDFFAKIPANSGLHFLPIPFSKTFADYYALAELSSKEYPTLVAESQPVETIGVPAVLAVYNWQKDGGYGSDRYRRVERFTEAFFSKWDKFQQPPRHPKWRDVNLAATVPGWNRWSFAEEMLRRLRTTEVTDPQVASADFFSFLKSKGSAFANLTQEQRNTLFVEFLQWQKERSVAGR